MTSNRGSEHEPHSTCLLDMMVAGFIDEFDVARPIESSTQCETMDANITEEGHTPLQSVEKQIEILEAIISDNCPGEQDLLAETVKCLERATKIRQPECLKLSVMCHLRNVGYDAAICKSRPNDNSRSFPSGNYEYIDVILKTTNSGRSIRLFVDLDFRSQFEIARPTAEYRALLGLLPKIYVGRAQKLQSILKVMCEGVKNSLGRKGMYLPPWRKYKYMHSMWLGSYKRSVACNSKHDHVHGVSGSNMRIPGSCPVTELMGMSKRVWNTIYADVAEEYPNLGSPRGGLVLSKPSTGKMIISALACAIMEAGLTSLPSTAESERLCLPEALTKVAAA
eukprot:PITA_06596